MKRSSMLAAALFAAGTVAPGDADDRAELLKWRQEREQRLQAPGGWLTVVGLSWLHEGENPFGADAAADVVLPPGSAPARAGVFELHGDEASVRLAPGVQATLGGQAVAGRVRMRADTTGAPDVLELGRLSLHVIERGGRLGVRVKDPESPQRKAFTGLSWFEPDEAYRVEARFVPYDPPRTLNVPNVLGRSAPMSSPGRAEFVLAGESLSLDAVLEEPGATELFFIFRDRTSGSETYGGGRFLYSDLPRDGRLILDFNRAYSPPCAFTAFATCPLPPPQNVLRVRVPAGEKAPPHPPAH